MKNQLRVAANQIIQEIPNLIAILLFGSYETKYETPQSDLDLAILAETNIDGLVLWELAQEIAIKINRDVDLIDLRQASKVFTYQVFSANKVIYCVSKKDLAFFENVSISMYLDFHETRKDFFDHWRGKLKNG